MPKTDIMDFLNEYFDRLGSIALRHGSTIDKFVGDGFMVRFNVPRPMNDFASEAIGSALAMQAEFTSIRDEWLRLGRPLQGTTHRIGIATGSVMGGLMGHSQYLSYTVIGEAVNRAASLCEQARQTESGILICRMTVDAAQHSGKKVPDFIKHEFTAGEIAYEIRA